MLFPFQLDRLKVVKTPMSTDHRRQNIIAASKKRRPSIHLERRGTIRRDSKLPLVDTISKESEQAESVTKQDGTRADSVTKQDGTTGAESVTKQAGTTGAESVTKQAGATGAESVTKQAGTTGAESVTKQAGATGADGVTKQEGLFDSSSKELYANSLTKIQKKVTVVYTEYCL